MYYSHSWFLFIPSIFGIKSFGLELLIFFYKFCTSLKLFKYYHFSFYLHADGYNNKFRSKLCYLLFISCLRCHTSVIRYITIVQHKNKYVINYTKIYDGILCIISFYITIYITNIMTSRESDNVNSSLYSIYYVLCLH